MDFEVLKFWSLFWDENKEDERRPTQQPCGCEEGEWEVWRSYRSKETKKGGIAQLARASALQAEGRRFDSDYLHN